MISSNKLGLKCYKALVNNTCIRIYIRYVDYTTPVIDYSAADTGMQLTEVSLVNAC